MEHFNTSQNFIEWVSSSSYPNIQDVCLSLYVNQAFRPPSRFSLLSGFTGFLDVQYWSNFQVQVQQDFQKGWRVLFILFLILILMTPRAYFQPCIGPTSMENFIMQLSYSLELPYMYFVQKKTLNIPYLDRS